MNTEKSSDPWIFKWHGETVWDSNNCDVYAECWFDLSLEFKIIDPQKLAETISKYVSEDPSKYPDDPRQYLNDHLAEILDDDFEFYVTCEDYYTPAAEDYHENAEQIIEEFATASGLKPIFIDYDGETSDYKSYPTFLAY